VEASGRAERASTGGSRWRVLLDGARASCVCGAAATPIPCTAAGIPSPSPAPGDEPLDDEREEGAQRHAEADLRAARSGRRGEGVGGCHLEARVRAATALGRAEPAAAGPPLAAPVRPAPCQWRRPCRRASPAAACPRRPPRPPASSSCPTRSARQPPPQAAARCPRTPARAAGRAALGRAAHAGAPPARDSVACAPGPSQPRALARHGGALPHLRPAAAPRVLLGRLLDGVALAGEAGLVHHLGERAAAGAAWVSQRSGPQRLHALASRWVRWLHANSLCGARCTPIASAAAAPAAKRGLANLLSPPPRCGRRAAHQVVAVHHDAVSDDFVARVDQHHVAHHDVLVGHDLGAARDGALSWPAGAGAAAPCCARVRGCSVRPPTAARAASRLPRPTNRRAPGPARRARP
jgi:hypothetical protein